MKNDDAQERQADADLELRVGERTSDLARVNETLRLEITKHERAEAAIRDSRAIYERLVHSLDVVVWEADPATYRFTFVSPQAEAMFGYPVAKWLEPSFWVEHIHPEDREPSLAFCQEQCRRRLDHEFEYRMIAADGRSVWVLDKVRFSPIGDNVVRLAGTIQDISAQKAAAATQARLEGQLRQALKMEAIGRLAGGIAHDFNNLLTVINGYSDILVERLAADDPLQDAALQIQHAGERAADLTRQLLAFGRQQVLTPKVLNLNSAVCNTEKMLRRLIGEDVILTTALDPDLGLVKADPGQLEQVFINLAVNARDAMPRGGSLTIETRNVSLDEAYCRTRAEIRAGEYVLLAVSDTGIGMEDATLARIFEPFFTTKEQGKGTGLGLATVHGIVSQSGGHIAVYSEPGQGTTFKVYLPRLQETAATKRPGLGTRKLPPGTETVLWVEDEDSVRALGSQILRTCGYTVLEAPNGRDALEVSARHQGTIHLLMSDVVMPYLGGRDLAERIRLTRPDCKVLFLSGYTDDAVVRHGVLQAEYAFVQKPFTAVLLAQKVRAVLDS